MKDSELKPIIQNAILTKDAALFKAIQMIYSHQTESEKFIGSTEDKNGVGFSVTDDRILSSFARQIDAWRTGMNDYRKPLTFTQIKVARKLVPKYWRQLVPAARIKLKEKENLDGRNTT